MVITVSCPACDTSFPVDPNKIPEAGVKVRCSQCAHVFRVERPAPAAAAPALPEIGDAPEPTTPPVTEPGSDGDWEIERDAHEQVAAAEEPSPEATPESLPDGGSDLPDWAASAGTGVEDALGDLSGDVPEPDLDFATPDVPDLDLAAPDLPDPDLDLAAPGGSEADPLDWAADITLEPPVTEQVEEESMAEVEPFAEPEPEPAPAAEPEPEPAPVQGFTFGKRDPLDKARRLARVLVSDMVMYNAERHQLALSRDTLAEDFEEEIEKSWKEFVDQVGPEIAEGEGQGFWRHALNDILAKGAQLF